MDKRLPVATGLALLASLLILNPLKALNMPPPTTTNTYTANISQRSALSHSLTAPCLFQPQPTPAPLPTPVYPGFTGYPALLWLYDWDSDGMISQWELPGCDRLYTAWPDLGFFCESPWGITAWLMHARGGPVKPGLSAPYPDQPEDPTAYQPTPADWARLESRPGPVWAQPCDLPYHTITMRCGRPLPCCGDASPQN